MNLGSGAVYSDKLAIFSKPIADVSVLKREWVNIQPTTEWGKGSTINFEVSGETNAYIDLKSTKLRATIQIVDSKGAPIAADASVGIVNQILYSTCMLSQVDLTLQHTTIKSLGPYYAYKAITDKILNSSIDDDNRKDRLSMYIKDRGENIGSTDSSTLDNISLRIREASTRGDQLLDLMGDLQLDFFKQDSLLIDGILIKIKMIPARDVFTLMTKSGVTEEYSLKLVKTSPDICYYHIAPNIIRAHKNVSQMNNALYPIQKSVINTFRVDKGYESARSNSNLFAGQIPYKIYLCMVATEAYDGSRDTNPFYFQHFNVNHIAYLLNNTSIPNQPLKPNFKTKNYVDCYSTLFRGGKSTNVSYEEFSRGAAIFEIDIAAELENSNVPSMKQAGEGCIELRFEDALADNITVIIYGTFRGNVEISGSGEVS